MASETKPIVGTGADDLVLGTAAADLLMGVAGDDVLRGLAGDDRLVGGVGNDELDGGFGSDALAGGPGADLFVFSYGDLISSLPPEGTTEAQYRLDLGHDVVADFELGKDYLQVRAGSDPVVVPASELSRVLLLTQADVDGDGTLDTRIDIDFTDSASGVHYTDPNSSITLLGVSGATLEQLFAG